jgi:hypothetical protein
MSEDKQDGAPEYRSLTTDIAIVAAPTVAIVAKHLLDQGDKPKGHAPPPQEPKK